MISWKKLKNQISWLLVPTHEQMSTVVVMISAGSGNETKKNRGVAHVLEHVLFKGTKNFPTAIHWNKAIESIGGESNAFTTPEYTYFTITVPHQHIETAMMMAADLVRSPLFPSRGFSTEKKVIIQEIIERFDPSVMIDDITERSLFGDQPLGWNIVGSANNIRHMSIDTVKRFYKKHYTPSLVSVGITGPFDIHQTQDMIETYFGNWKNNKKKIIKKYTPIPKNIQPVIAIRNLNEKTMLVSHALIAYGNERKRAIWNLWATILGGGTQSRLYSSIREALGLVYNIEAYTMWYSICGYMQIFFESNTERAHKIQNKIFEIIHEIIKEKPITGQELSLAKKLQETKLLKKVDEPSELLVYYMIKKIISKTPKSWQKEAQLYRSITLKEVHQLSKQITKRRDWHTVWIGDNPNSKKILETIKQYL